MKTSTKTLCINGWFRATISPLFASLDNITKRGEVTIENNNGLSEPLLQTNLVRATYKATPFSYTQWNQIELGVLNMVNKSLIDLPIPHTVYNQRNQPLLMKFLRWWHLWNSHWENPRPVLVDRNLSLVDVKKISFSLSTRSKISIETRENPTFILTMGLSCPIDTTIQKFLLTLLLFKILCKVTHLSLTFRGAKILSALSL